MLKSQTRALYLQPPADFISTMEVVACCITYENKILFLKRNATKPEGNTWCGPGGKRDPAETLQAAMTREIFEETGLTIPEQSLEYCQKAYGRYPTFDFIYHLFRFDFNQKPPTIQINPGEHQEYQWLSLAEGLQLPLTPGVDVALSLLFEGSMATK